MGTSAHLALQSRVQEAILEHIVVVVNAAAMGFGGLTSLAISEADNQDRRPSSDGPRQARDITNKLLNKLQHKLRDNVA